MKRILFLLLLITVCASCVLCGCISNDIDDELTDYDRDILRYYRTPNIEENFEDNAVNVILKNAYSNVESISFSDFPIADIAKVKSITNYSDTIYAGDGKELKLKEKPNQLLRFELYDHSKETVITIIKELDRLKIVLLAQPHYIYDVDYDI